MSARELLQAVACDEGWTTATQLEMLLQYIEQQQSRDAFEEFLSIMRADFDPDDQRLS